MSSQDSPSVKPEVVFTEDLLNEIATGRLRIPRFQRPFVWKPSNMIELFDSIYKGYPIGGLLFWEPIEAMESLDKIGPLEIPKVTNQPLTYVLDGQQRLTTLYVGLRLPEDMPINQQQDWQWWIWFDLKTEEFIHVKKNNHEPSLIPLRTILSTVDFLDESRKLVDHFGKAEAHDLIKRAEHLAQKIKNYRLAITRIKGGNLEQAVTIFSRLNTTGQKMSPDQMVSALTYRDQDKQPLSDDIDLILEDLSQYNFDSISRMTIFRAIVAAAGKEIHRSDWESIAKKLIPELDQALVHARKGLSEAARFLYEDIRLPGDRLLPYSNQLLLLSEFFHYCPDPHISQRDNLIIWFWAFSFSGYFTSVSTTQLNRALKEMQLFAVGKKHIKKLIEASNPLRPFPIKVDFASSRVRALLVFLSQSRPLRFEDGTLLSPAQLTGFKNQQSLRLYPRSSQVKADLLYSPANIIFCDKTSDSLKNRLQNIPQDLSSKILSSHAIPSKAYIAFKKGDAEGFLEIRLEHLMKIEEDFMQSLNIPLPENE